MAYLYRFKCKPNWPVCDGIIMFYCNTVIPGEVMTKAKELADKLGFTNIGTELELSYLGEFEPTSLCEQIHDDSVLTYSNGEY